mgnify:CR=1 FL=1
MKLKKISESKCNGLIYRAKVNHYATNDEIVFEIRLRKLKKKSCPGCEKCDWLYEAIGEICEDWPVEGICDVEHGKLYTLDICNEWQNWETGKIEDWDLCLKKVKEEEDESNSKNKS